MMLIDTNIISEMMKPIPDVNVMKWLDQQEILQLFVSTITLAEISYGINILPEGGRRSKLEIAFEKAIFEAFTNRILTFDESAAHLYGQIMGHRKTLGQPMGVPDGQIAAIARAHDMSIVTRNIRDFSDCGLQVINPFDLIASPIHS